ncbi:MAG: ATP-binding protein [Phormidesmis sp.]
MKHVLLIEDDEGKRTIELQKDSSSIGRDPRNSIVLNSREISRQHAVLLRLPQRGKSGHQFRIIDGNFQGKPSTNGLLINGCQKTSHNLSHGDEIIFAAAVGVRYFTFEDGPSSDWLLANDEAVLDHMETYIAPAIGISEDQTTATAIDDASLERLASFPELFPHPIIEVSITGELTYLNPAVVKQFPEIESQKFTHPLLVDVIDVVKGHSSQQFTREVTIGERTFEQAVNYISQSELIRMYVLDITSRKHADDAMKALHQKLEVEFELRTQQLNEANERLKEEKMALSASHATNRALLNAMPDPMFRVDSQANIVNFKVPQQHTLPFEPKSCLHKPLSAVFTPSATKAIKACIEQALEKKEIQVVEFQLPQSQTLLDFEARIVMSAPEEVMVVFRDITERKRNEAEMLSTLDRERELNELKTRFVAMTSHEFRTPLTTILSSAELLEHYSERWDVAKQSQYLDKIKTATQHMTELINDVLLINRTESGKQGFHPQPLVINEFCQEVIEELQITTVEHSLVMRSRIPNIACLLDSKLMRHILTNLLSNAINYSPQGGEVLVEIDQQGDEMRLSVKDSGIGIPEETQARLFESFIRGSNVGSISGTGLGLAIVKRSVDLHQGRIECESEVGVGTRFVVSLPMMVVQGVTYDVE